MVAVRWVMICKSVKKTVGVRARTPDLAMDGSAVRGGSGDDKSKRQKRERFCSRKTRERSRGSGLAIERCARIGHDDPFIPVLGLPSQASCPDVRRCALH
ncbi:hypothetical protein TMPK1_24410 [Rhodospirillales bacterium TMPK1]|uniref:Uncharacterized protein n=1 Tax=Roseiterribacter gracilis TaxID=2812848 RepID=A0A8S8XBW8_9PROT|nr:hypothetical protein TMPK1_24410 [Rhodospirillales bacterium TMPK1]